MRRRLMAALTVLALVTGWGVLVAPSASAHPWCGLVWGSQPQAVAGPSPGIVADVRAGRHACFDRLVLEVDDAVLSGWTVRYVDRVTTVGTGAVVPVRGGARLEVVARVPVVPTDAFFGPDGELVDTAAYRTFRHVAWAGSADGRTGIGLGVRARLPFRAFVLPGPGDGSRLVVDVAHRWCAPGHAVC